MYDDMHLDEEEERFGKLTHDDHDTTTMDGSDVASDGAYDVVFFIFFNHSR